MKYPQIVRPLTDRDQIIAMDVRYDVEDLVMDKGTMVIVGMFFDDTEERNWTLHISESESHKITITEFSSHDDTKNHYSDTCARFTVE